MTSHASAQHRPLDHTPGEQIVDLLALAELDAARGQEALSDELGDLLFATVNLARHLEIDAEQALRRATDKFERRFRLVEQGFEAQGQALGEATLATLEAAWERAKQQEKERVPKHP